MDVLTLRMSKNHTEQSLVGAGAIKGKSAYEIAVEEGFKGSQKAWLASLVGDTPDIGIGANGNWFLNGQDTGVIASPSLAGYATEDFVEEKIEEDNCDTMIALSKDEILAICKKEK